MKSAAAKPVASEVRPDDTPSPTLSLEAHGWRLSPVADERSIDICERVMDITAALFNVSGNDLRRPGRSTTSVARVRQIGMYVAHVILGLTMTAIGRGFGRDRTTVQHACHLVEDMRDDEEFDQIVKMVENITAAAFRGRTDVRR